MNNWDKIITMIDEIKSKKNSFYSQRLSLIKIDDSEIACPEIVRKCELAIWCGLYFADRLVPVNGTFLYPDFGELSKIKSFCSEKCRDEYKRNLQTMPDETRGR